MGGAYGESPLALIPGVFGLNLHQPDHRETSPWPGRLTGVFGAVDADWPYASGVHGVATNLGGKQTVGVTGETHSYDRTSAGVWGNGRRAIGVVATSETQALAARTESGLAIEAKTQGGVCVLVRNGGVNETRYGVVSQVESQWNGSVALYGEATNEVGKVHGVVGKTASDWDGAAGVCGVATATTRSDATGVEGVTEGTTGRAAGVAGFATASAGSANGVFGRTDTRWGAGVRGEATQSNAYGLVSIGRARVDGDVWINGSVYVRSGGKHAVVDTAAGLVALHAEEAPQAWFADYGVQRLEDGSAWVELDSRFVESISADTPYHVFLQPYGEALLFVADRTAAGFAVRRSEAVPGDDDVEFSYRVAGLRRGFADARFTEVEPPPEPDASESPLKPELPPDFEEPELPDLSHLVEAEASVVPELRRGADPPG